MKTVSHKFRIPILLIALIGFGIMAYLTYIHYAEAQSFCDISAEVSCDVVTTSIYSEVFGIPMSILGLLYFATVALVVGLKKQLAIYKGLFFLTVFVIVPSLYLTLTEIVFINSFCVLCESSKVLMLAIGGMLFAIVKPASKDLLRMSMPVLIAGVVAAGVTYFAQTSVGTTQDHTPLVEHMNEKGWVYYKSYTCSNCRRQEQIIGPAYTKLNAVECHPDGPNGQPELCLAKDIDKTPTWLLEPDGEELMRLEGTQSIEKLKEVSEYSEDSN